MDFQRPPKLVKQSLNYKNETAKWGPWGHKESDMTGQLNGSPWNMGQWEAGRVSLAPSCSLSLVAWSYMQRPDFQQPSVFTALSLV